MNDIKNMKSSSKVRFKILFKNIPIPTYTWQKIQDDLVLIDYNFAAEDITKGQIKSFLGSKASHMYNDDPEILNDLNRCANEQINFSKEMKYHMKSTGEVKYFDVKYVFIRPDLVLVHTEDITARKQAEKELKESEKNLKMLNKELEHRVEERTMKLKESEEKYRVLFENSPYAIGLVDMTGKIVDVNQFHEKIGNYNKSDFIGKNFNELLVIPQKYLPIIVKDFKRLLKGEFPKPKEIQLSDKEGNLNWYYLRLSLINLGNKSLIQVISQDITEIKETEKKLKESEEKYRSFVENFQGIAFRGHQDFSAAFFHGAVEEITGYKEEDFISGNAKWNELIHPDDLSNVQKAVKQFHSTSIKLDKKEYRIISKDGKIHWIAENIQKIYDASRREEVVHGTIYDITEKKEAEQKLKESEEKYRLISENANDLITIINQEFKHEYINEQAYINILGYSNEDIIGKTPLEQIHPDEIKHVTKALREGWKSGEGTVIIRLKHKNWHYCWLESKGKTFIDSDGKKKAILISRDITERMNAEEKLKESEEKFRTITEQSILGLAIVQDNVLKYVNKGLADIFGYTIEEMRGWEPGGFVRVIHPDDREMVVEQGRKKQLGLSDVKTQYQIKGLKRNGEIVWIEIFSKTINYRGKTADLVTLIDITEKKRAERELREINRLKTELLRRASHELKTPFVSIKGNTDLLLDSHYEKLDYDTISIIDDIKEGCLRLEDLINDLLESSKLESGRIQLKMTKEDLAFLIRFCVSELKGLATARNQKISLEIQDELVTSFEKERIYEVIINLLSNAIKYTPPNGIIKIKSEIKDNAYIISVKDNGIGFTEEEKEQIFKQFGKIERYGQGWDLGIEGTGLGLYISKKIIELHGGNIWVESEGRNKGTIFYFSLPFITD